MVGLLLCATDTIVLCLYHHLLLFEVPLYYIFYIIQNSKLIIKFCCMSNFVYVYVLYVHTFVCVPVIMHVHTFVCVRVFLYACAHICVCACVDHFEF